MRNSQVTARVFWSWLCDEKFSSMRMHVTCDQRARTWWGTRCSQELLLCFSFLVVTQTNPTLLYFTFSVLTQKVATCGAVVATDHPTMHHLHVQSINQVSSSIS